MILKQLRLVNFRRYVDLDILFRDGITAIVGLNGSGKSTILEAILWCLYGNRAARTGKEGIKRQNAAEAETCQVSLDFALGGVDYCLTRSLVGKGARTETKLTQEGRLDTVTTREVDNHIIHLIGLNLKGFLSSFFARQKELNALSDTRPAERKNHLAKMLGVGRLDNAIALLKEEIKGVRQRIDILQNLLIDPDVVSEEISLGQAEAEKLAEEKDIVGKKLNVSESRLAELTARVGTLREAEKRFAKLDSEKTALDSRLSSLADDLKRLNDELRQLDEVAERLPELQAQFEDIADWEKTVDELKAAAGLASERARLEDEAKQLKNRYDKRLRREKELREKLAHKQAEVEPKEALVAASTDRRQRRDELREKYRKTAPELAALKADISRLENQQTQITQLGPEAACALCLRPFGDEYTDIEAHFRQELEALRQKAEPLESRLKAIEADGEALSRHLAEDRERLEMLRTEEKEMASLQAEQTSLGTALAEDKERLNIVEARLGEIGEVAFGPDRLAEAEANLVRRRTAREEFVRLSEQVRRRGEVSQGRERAEAALKTATSQQADVVQKINDMKYEPDALPAAEDELARLRDEAGDARLGMERLEGRIRLLAAEIELRRKRLEEYEASRREIGELRLKLTYHEKLLLLFNDFRIYLIGRIRPALSRQTSRLFHDLTGGRYQEVALDEDYNLCIYDQGEQFSIDRFSGGEIDLANLCFRLAISIEMASTAGIEHSFIILDEIFGSQDSERQQLIVEGLVHLKNRFRQIVIVSHIEDVKELAENIIIVQLDAAGVSSAGVQDGS